MDDHFSLEINTILDINLNPSHGSDHHEFLPLSQNNIYQRHDHQAGSFYSNPITRLPTNDLAKRIAGDENSNRLNFNSGANRKNYGCGGKRRRKKNKAAEEEKQPREVVHVRARRGEATDSHSLAERMRREKINAKLRCLQELVPGCYKTMKMSVMLDITTNYIQSLHNQIEFLSMNLSTASMFYDFNSPEMDAWDTTIKGENGYEAQAMDKIGEEGYGDLLQFPSTWSL